MLRRCRHKWEVLVSEKFDSPLGEVVRKGDLTEMRSVPPSVLQSYLVVILSCANCGKLNKTVQELG